MVRFADGSRYLQNDLAVLVIGRDEEKVDLRTMNGVFACGRRGVIIIGDL